ncbi:hypothetical protein Tco_1531112 [Tanacetum coccineum]
MRVFTIQGNLDYNNNNGNRGKWKQTMLSYTTTTLITTTDSMGCLHEALFRVAMLDQSQGYYDPLGKVGDLEYQVWPSSFVLKIDREDANAFPYTSLEARFSLGSFKDSFKTTDLILPLAHLFVGDKRWRERVKYLHISA